MEGVFLVGAEHNGNALMHSSGDQKSEVKVSAGLGSLWGLEGGSFLPLPASAAAGPSL